MGWFSPSTMSRGIAAKEIKSLIKVLDGLGKELGVKDDRLGPNQKNYSDNVAFHKDQLFAQLQQFHAKVDEIGLQKKNLNKENKAEYRDFMQNTLQAEKQLSTIRSGLQEMKTEFSKQEKKGHGFFSKNMSKEERNKKTEEMKELVGLYQKAENKWKEVRTGIAVKNHSNYNQLKDVGGGFLKGGTIAASMGPTITVKDVELSEEVQLMKQKGKKAEAQVEKNLEIVSDALSVILQKAEAIREIEEYNGEQFDAIEKQLAKNTDALKKANKSLDDISKDPFAPMEKCCCYIMCLTILLGIVGMLFNMIYKGR